MEEITTYPKIPTSNWYDIRKQFSKTLPSIVTPTYLKSLLNLGSIKSAQNLIPQLKMLGLIDEDSKPTELANKWRNEDTYNDACRIMFESVYPEELRSLYIGDDIDKNSVAKWFMSTTKCGEGASKYFASSYIYLAIPNFNPPEKSTSINTPKRTTSIKKVAQKTTERFSTDEVKTPIKEEVRVPVKSVQPAVHIDLQIHISPESSVEQVDAIFASIAKHLYEK